MALLELEYHSHALDMKARSYVILPQQEQGIGIEGAGEQKQYPVLWLLHGASDDHSVWLRRTSIERYVAPLGLAVVMPSVHLSRYTNMAHGPGYFDYVAKELPELLRGMLPLSPRKADNFVAGLSMGGYGAMKMGLSCPEQYAAIGCLSAGNLIAWKGATSFSAKRKHGGEPIYQAIYGVEDAQELLGDPQVDLYAMATEALRAGKTLPRIFHACGTEDFLLENARETAAWFEKNTGTDYTYHEAPGTHDWSFWEEWIQRFLQWL